MSTWKPFYGLLRREVLRFFKVINQTLATPLISTTLYLLIFGMGLGRQLSHIYSFTYLDFLIPGLVMLATLRNAFDNVTSSIAVSKFCGELEDLKMVPLSVTQITWALALGGVIRGVVVGVATLIIGEVFSFIQSDTWLEIHSPMLFFLFLFLGALAFSFIGICVAMSAQMFEQVNMISTFILMPLIYLSGVFFSLEHLHPLWRHICILNPVLYMVNGVRFSMLNVSDVPLWVAFFISFASLFIFYFLAHYSLQKGSYKRW